MNHLLESIVARWPTLEPDRVYLIWHICRKHRLNPGMDLCLAQRGDGRRQVLQFGVHGLQRYLETTKTAVLHPIEWIEHPRSVEVSVTTPFLGGDVRLAARISALDHPALASQPDQLARRAWQALLSRLFQPLRVDLDNLEILAEPRDLPAKLDPQAPIQSVEMHLGTLSGTANAGDLMAVRGPNSGLPAKSLPPKPKRQRGQRITIEAATETLRHEMRKAQLIPPDGNESWAMDITLRTIFSTLSVESWNDGGMARQTAALFIQRLRQQRGPSPVAATGDIRQLTAYFAGIRATGSVMAA